MYRHYLQSLDKNKRILEIGPLTSPMAPREDGYSRVFYADIRPTDEIREFYRNDPAVDCEKIVEIDYVLQENYAKTFHDLEKFDYVLASHVIEHMPSLIFSLLDFAEILKDGGRLCLTIPDKRYCFDHYRYPTTFAEAFDIYHRGVTNNPTAVMDFISNTTPEVMSDPVYWCKNPCDYSFMLKNPRLAMGKELYLSATAGAYIDAHFSVFTPESFLILIFYLTAFGLFPYECEDFWPTEKGTLEFNVVLKRIFPYHPEDEQEKARRLGIIIVLLESIKDDTLQKSVVQEMYHFVDRETFEQLVQERERLETEKNILEAQYQSRSLESQQFINSLLTSKSWKLTRPLRDIMRIAKTFLIGKK